MSSGIFLQWQGRRCACLVSGLGLSSEEWRGVCCASPGSVALVARTYPRKGVECAALPRLCSADRADATEEWHGVCSPSHGSVALVARTQGMAEEMAWSVQPSPGSVALVARTYPRKGVECAALPRVCGAGRADATEEWHAVFCLPPALWRWSRGRNRGMAWSVQPSPRVCGAGRADATEEWRGRGLPLPQLPIVVLSWRGTRLVDA